MKTISYIFIGGRKDNYLSKTIQAKEFYYGLPHFSDLGHKINIIEFNEINNNLNFLFKIFDKILNKFFSIPSYTHKINTISNYKKLRNSDNIILVSESTGFSSLFMLFFLKKKTRVSLFVMGLYSKKIRYDFLKSIHNFFIKLLTSLVDDILILGKGEFDKALEFHKKNKKLHYFPFCIDTDFWKNSDKHDICNNDEILFIGNDGNRDFNLVIEITKRLKTFKFRLVSQNEIILMNKSENTIIHKGKWGSQSYTDKELKSFYLNCKFVIIPLTNSTQPSGQSVALQAMSLGIPVLISLTDGFWDNDFYEDKKNIFFVNPSNLETWENLIKELYHEANLISKVGENASRVVQNNFHLDKFNKMLSDILNI